MLRAEFPKLSSGKAATISRHLVKPLEHANIFTLAVVVALCLLTQHAAGRNDFQMHDAIQIAAGALILVTFAVQCGSLLCLSIYDINERRIPNRLVRPLYASGLAFSAMLLVLHGQDGVNAVLSSIQRSAAGVAVCAVVICLAVLVGNTGSRKSLVGMGDVRLITACALTTGIDCTFSLLTSCLAAVVYSLVFHSRSFPFGPFLSVPYAVVMALQIIMIM